MKSGQRTSQNLLLARFPHLPDLLYYLIIFFLPTQLGKHFWPDFSYVYGLRIDYLSPTIYMTDLLIGSLFIVWLFNNSKEILRKFSIFSSQFSTKRNFSRLLPYLFFFYLLLNISLSQIPLLGLYGLLKLLEFSFFGYYTYQFLNKKRFQTVLLVLSISVFFQSVLAIAQFFNQGSLGGLFYVVGERTFSGQTPGIANVTIDGKLFLRPYATFPHPNVLAGFLCILLPLLFHFLFVSRSQLVSVALAVSVGIGTIALLLTFSRAAISLWILVLCFSLFQKRMFSMKASLSILLVVLLGIVSYSPFRDRFLQTSFIEESFLIRKDLLLMSFEMIKNHFLFGVGMLQFLPALPAFTSISTFNTLQPVHNIFFLITSELGIIGLCFVLYFLFKTYKKIHKKKFITSYLLFYTFLVLGFFDHYFLTLQQGQLLSAFLFGVLWSKKGHIFA